MSERVRIRKGVRPYSGRIMPARRHVYPNGRTVWLVNVSTTTAYKSLGVGRDEREYEMHEVEVLEEVGR